MKTIRNDATEHYEPAMGERFLFETGLSTLHLETVPMGFTNGCPDGCAECVLNCSAKHDYEHEHCKCLKCFYGERRDNKTVIFKLVL